MTEIEDEFFLKDRSDEKVFQETKNIKQETQKEIKENMKTCLVNKSMTTQDIFNYDEDI